MKKYILLPVMIMLAIALAVLGYSEHNVTSRMNRLIDPSYEPAEILASSSGNNWLGSNKQYVAFNATDKFDIAKPPFRECVEANARVTCSGWMNAKDAKITPVSDLSGAAKEAAVLSTGQNGKAADCYTMRFTANDAVAHYCLSLEKRVGYYSYENR